MISDKLNTIPDIVKPTGKIAGPTTAVAGQTVTFTADVTDAQSGIDPDGFAWTKDSTAAGGGQTVGIAFPQSGWYTIRVSYRDRAGNTATASTDIRVSDPPSDNTDPTGTITGPAFAVAGQSATFTANVTDSGSGVDPGSFSWSRDFSSAGRGNSVTMMFPAPGTDTVSVSFSDLAGNRNSVSVTVPVAPKPEDRPKPVTVNTPAPVGQVQGRPLRDPDQGRLPPAQERQAKLGCTGDIVFTMKKAKRLLSARTTKLNTACKYNKSFSVAKSKVGEHQEGRDHRPLLRQRLACAGQEDLPGEGAQGVAAVRSQGLLQPGRGVARTGRCPPTSGVHSMRTRLVGAATVAALAAGALATTSVLGSSHREAPRIMLDPAADNTDVYAFVAPDAPGS